MNRNILYELFWVYCVRSLLQDVMVVFRRVPGSVREERREGRDGEKEEGRNGEKGSWREGKSVYV